MAFLALKTLPYHLPTCRSTTVIKESTKMLIQDIRRLALLSKKIAKRFPQFNSNQLWSLFAESFKSSNAVFASRQVTATFFAHHVHGSLSKETYKRKQTVAGRIVLKFNS